jgi:hypothetical protein
MSETSRKISLQKREKCLFMLRGPGTLLRWFPFKKTPEKIPDGGVENWLWGEIISAVPVKDDPNLQRFISTFMMSFPKSRRPSFLCLSLRPANADCFWRMPVHAVQRPMSSAIRPHGPLDADDLGQMSSAINL